ncbi:MAG TPA: hypothetical protein VF145_12120, partial [Chitinophagaceae bacterium]
LVPVLMMLASCAAGHKKVIVLSQGSANIDTDNRKIDASGQGHEEKTVLIHDEGQVPMELNTPFGKNTVQLDGSGLFIINLKQDTIVGSLVNYTAPKTQGRTITEPELRANIDSLEQILTGRVSAEKKTFYILPLHAVKVTDNTDAHIVTPFHQMTSISVESGKTPEVYRFYPIAEVRVTLLHLKDLLGEGGRAINE